MAGFAAAAVTGFGVTGGAGRGAAGLIAGSGGAGRGVSGVSLVADALRLRAPMASIRKAERRGSRSSKTPTPI
ncbi:MAG: hypothetical protein WCG22_02840 [Lentisphaerota bacterium]